MIKLELHPEPKILRQFAWVSLVAFPLVAWILCHLTLGLELSSGWVYGTASVGVVVLAAELAGLHAITRLVFRMLVIASFPIGLVVFTVIIGLVYYGVFTPMALAFRLVGRDALNRRPDRGAKSYWFKRPSARPARSYFKLY